MNHLNEEQLILYHYGEVEDQHEIASHLEACEACRASYRSLQRVFTVVDAMPIPQRTKSYGAEVWRQLRPQIGSVSKPKPRGLRRYFLWPRWAVAGALALLVFGAFLAGRFWPQPTTGTGSLVAQSPQPLSLQARERVLLREVGDHLERSQLALIELINSRTNGVVDITVEQTLARELAAINRLFRRTAADAGEFGTASLLEELELVLVEVANGPAKLSADEFTALRKRIGTDGLLFKVKVIAAQIRARERDASREMATNRS